MIQQAQFLLSRLFDLPSAAAALLLVVCGINNVQAEADIYYIHTDHLGTPQVLTDQDQNVAWKAHYSPFGAVELEVEQVQVPLRFPGQYYDEESGLYYNYFRDYDSGLGRYVQSDPIGLNGGLNTYGYVGGNPITYVDPFGLFACNCQVSSNDASRGGGTAPALKQASGQDLKRFYYTCTCQCPKGKKKTFQVIGGSDNWGQGNQFPHGGDVSQTSSSTGQMYQYWTGYSKPFPVDTKEPWWKFPSAKHDHIKENIDKIMEEFCSDKPDEDCDG